MIGLPRCATASPGGSVPRRQLLTTICGELVGCIDTATYLDVSWIRRVPGNGASTKASERLLPVFRQSSAELGIELFDLDDDRQGIVHIAGPELGLSLPGATIVCGDSHTCTQGGVGALAAGTGNTEVTQVLATQTLTIQRPATMQVVVNGGLAPCERQGSDPAPHRP